MTRRHNPAAARLAGLRYQFVDCRWDLADPSRGRELYLGGHIPGASFLDVDTELSDLSVPDAGRHPLPSPERFADAARRAGIGRGVFVVAYGTMGGAERLWWLLRHFGHTQCAVLGGGIDTWRGPLSRGEENTEPGAFAVSPGGNDVITADELAARLGDERLAVVDARVPARYRGEPNPVDRPPGRLPGAVNVPWDDPVLTDDLRAAPELAVYCGSGVTACVVVFELARAGRPDARLYPGSYSDWSARGLPTERN